MSSMGYKKVYMPDHPHAMAGGYVYEHRLIIEQQIGRYLDPGEQVHHRDENKHNNNPENLLLCPSQKEHSQEHAFGDDFLIEALVHYADIHGRMPTRRQCDRHEELPNSSTYIRHFGSWSKAISMANDRIDMINNYMEGFA